METKKRAAVCQGMGIVGIGVANSQTPLTNFQRNQCNIIMS